MTRNPPQETLNHHYPESPPLSIDFIRKIPESGTRAWNRLAAYLLQLDMHIERAGAALLRCQPLEPGRVTVVWWKVRGAEDDDEKEPVPVVWKQNAEGKWYNRKIPYVGLGRRAKRQGRFALGYKNTAALLNALSELFELRRKTTELMRLERIRIESLVTLSQPRIVRLNVEILTAFGNQMERLGAMTGDVVDEHDVDKDDDDAN